MRIQLQEPRFKKVSALHIKRFHVYTSTHFELFSSSLTGAAIFITTVILGTVMIVSKVWPYNIGKYYVHTT